MTKTGLTRFEADKARRDSLLVEAEDLAGQQRKALALVMTATHKQKLAANAALQALLDPMTGLHPRQFKAFLDEGKPAKAVKHSQHCHMECSRRRPPTKWPFDDEHSATQAVEAESAADP